LEGSRFGVCERDLACFGLGCQYFERVLTGAPENALGLNVTAG
jgi:hypothetical protein